VARLPLDTLRLAKRLEEAGFAPSQAEAQVHVLTELLNLHETATKSDIRKLRLQKDLRLTEAQLRKEIQETESRLRVEIEKVRLEMRETEARLRADIHRSHNRVILWVAGLIAAQVPLFYLLQRFLSQIQ